MNRIKVGFNMHPRWACGESLPGFLEPLWAAGLRALEFELWDGDPDWPRILPLMEDCRQMGFELCFHAPYRRPHNIAGFAGEKRAEIQADYAPMLDVAARFAPAPVVIHGAWSETRPHETLYADTVAFLEWVLERYPALTPALENLPPNPRRIKIGATRGEIRDIVEEIDDRGCAPRPEEPVLSKVEGAGLGNPPRAASSGRHGSTRLGLCWDMGHDVVAGRQSTPDMAWLRHVVHVHLHDVDEHGTDHYPLLYGRTPYRTWLPALVQVGFNGIVTLEIKGEQLAHLGFEQVRQILAASVAEIAQVLATPSP